VVHMLEHHKIRPNTPQRHAVRLVSMQVSLVRQMRCSYKVLVRETDERMIHMAHTLIHEDTYHTALQNRLKR
jgi:hypothetical protein